MKNFSKIHITSSIFISANVLTILSLYEITNAIPHYFKKPSTVRLLSEVFRESSSGFVQKLPNGKLRASFLHSGQNTSALNNFNIRSGAHVYVKKNPNERYVYSPPGKYHRKVIEEGIAFKIITSSKFGLKKQIDIIRENENIIVTSQKGLDSCKHILKRTILDFGDAPSTSTQTPTSSSEPKIISTKYSSFNTNSKNFDVESKSEYNPLNSKLTSYVSKNNSTGIRESIMIHDDNIQTKIIENPDGSEKSFVTNKFNEIILTKTIDSNGNSTITKKIGHPHKFLTQIYNSNQNLLEETITDRDYYENKTYDRNGELILTTTMNRLEDGSMIGTSISQNSSITYERRNDGSLISTITRNSTGELIKQDFDQNNIPLNNPYRIN